MKSNSFGSIMYDGKIIDIDKNDIDELQKISKDLKEKSQDLNSKIITVFKQ